MTLSILRACGEFYSSSLAGKTSAIACAICAHIQGRNAVRFEQERRLTLLTVGSALPPGSEIRDERTGVGSLYLRLSSASYVAEGRSGQLSKTDATLGESASPNRPPGITGR